MQRLHEAEVLAEHGEVAEAYVRSQILTKALEAIGLPSLSIWERDVAEDGTVIDFDGRPMREKTAAALQVLVAPFEHERRLIEDYAQVNILDQLTSGQSVGEDSNHPDVDDKLAAAHGYHPDMRYLMKRLYQRTETSLILYSYSIPHGLGLAGVRQYEVNPDTSIEDLLAEYDQHAEEETGVSHFLGEIWTGESRDYSVIQARRIALETESRPYIDDFVEIVREIGHSLKSGELDRDAAGEMLDEYERGLLTLLLVKLNPSRAAELITAEDLEWAETLLEFGPAETMLAAAEISDRNQLDWIACGGILAALLGESQEWYGAYKSVGKCVNCLEGPKEIGEKGWCKSCIKGHCG